MTQNTPPFGFIDPIATQAMTGLEKLQAMIAGRLPNSPIRETMNFWLVAAEEGRAEFRGIPEKQHCNPFGAPHGGWYGTLLDSAMGCAVQSRLAAGLHYTTLEYKINITRAIPLGMEVRVIGESQHTGRSTGVSRGEIYGVEDGKLYATGSTTCIIFGG